MRKRMFVIAALTAMGVAGAAKLEASDSILSAQETVREAGGDLAGYGVAPEAALAGPAGCGMGCIDDSCCYGGHGRHLTWYAGAEATLLWTDANSAFAGAEVIDTNFGGIGVGSGSFNDMVVGGRVYLGFEGCNGWGVRGTYWQIDDDEIGSAWLANAFAEESVRAYTIDLEVTRGFCFGQWDTMLGFGVRYAELDLEAASALAYSDFGTSNAFAAAYAAHGFHGTGITGSLQGRRQIGCSNFKAFYNARGSVIWGDATAIAIAQTSAANVGGFTDALAIALAEGDDEAFFIGEIQAGIEYWHRLGCRSAMFFRVAGEYQYWEGSDDVFAAALAASAAPPAGAVAFASAFGDEVEFFGITIGGGLVW